MISKDTKRLLPETSTKKGYSSLEDGRADQQQRHVVIVCSKDDFDLHNDANNLCLDSVDVLPYSQHMIGIARLSYPIIASEFLQNVLLIVSIYFVGKLGKDELAACALASTWFNIW